MDDSTANPASAPTDTWQIPRRVGELMLKLLDGIERDINDGKLPSPHLEAYEALCRAEKTRLGL
jgi:hypothetical protein